MSLSIRTNVASLNAQRNLFATQLSLDSSLSRLSSGFRITKAGDDAAGLGISTKLESQIRSYGQATRNANDGLSVVQTTEAALNEQANILTRMRELAMQSGSDGVGSSERGYIDTESTKLLAELQRISQVTEYNGTKLLDGSAATLDFQVGIAATSNDRITLMTLNATTAAATATAPSLGPATATTAVITAALTAYRDAMLSNGYDDTAAATAAGNAASPLSNATSANDVSGLAHELFYAGALSAGASAFPIVVPAERAAGIALLNQAISGGLGSVTSMAGTMAAFATAIQGGATAGMFGTAADAATTYARANGYSFGVGARIGYVAALAFSAGYANVATTDPAGAPTLGTAATNEALATLAGTTTAGPGTAATTGGLGVAGLSLATKASSLSALASIDAALEVISSNRATLGATGNRLQSAIANIQSFSESLSAANSRIKDVDVAEETSRMSRSQILMQAGISVLAQANQMPQMALKLLG